MDGLRNCNALFSRKNSEVVAIVSLIIERGKGGKERKH